MSVLELQALPEREPVLGCPLCGGARATLVHRVEEASGRLSGTFELRRCTGCGLVYTSPLPTEHDLPLLYDERFYFSTGWWYEAFASLVIETIQTARSRRVEGLSRVGRVLDVGCGDGAFVHHMAAYGWDATGVDISNAACDAARRRGNRARILLGALEDQVFAPASFDLVTMWQVLEHVAHPAIVLGRCHELLEPGGIFVAAVPNIDGWSSQLTRSRWWGLDVPRHLVHWTPETLANAVEHAGFRVVRMRHRSLQYDPYGLLHSSLDWLFTRRHFLSDFAKRHTEMPRGELAWNAGVMVAAAPAFAPLALAVTSAAAATGHGGFIEVHARRDGPASVRNAGVHAWRGRPA